MDNATAPPILPGENTGDSTVAQTIADVKAKAADVRLNKDGTPRKPYKKRGSSDAPSVPAGPSAPSVIGGFTEPQIKASAQGAFSMAALATNCNVWFLQDAEADVFVPSATLALNQTFPNVATSKWGALTLASLSLGAVLIAKTLVYLQFKQEQKKAAPPDAVPSAT